MNYIVNSLAALRGARRALLLPARRLRRRGQPRAAGGAGVPAVAVDRRGALHHGAELRPARPDRSCATTPTACCGRTSRTRTIYDRRPAATSRRPGGSSGERRARGARAAAPQPPARSASRSPRPRARQRRHRRQRRAAGAGRSSCAAMRGSQTTSRPRSVSLRIRRPAPCFSDTAASATK